MYLTLTKSPLKNKKWRIIFPDNKSVDFGHSAYEDYTMHKDTTRKKSYISRHKSSENWNKSGIRTAGFWSKHLLWNQATLSESIRDVENRYKVNILKKSKE